MTTTGRPTAPARTAERVPRRRGETRSRMIAAAAEVFAEQGTTNVGIEVICDRAGYTRGAFYSNFASVDELLLAVHEHQAHASQQRLEQAIDSTLQRFTGPISVDDAVRSVLEVLPLDVEGFRLRTVFIAQATRHPEGQQLFSHTQDAQRRRLQDLLVSALRAAGRVPTVDAAVFTRAVLAAHDGAMALSLADGEEATRALRVEAVRGMLLGLTAPLDPGA